MKIKVCGMRDSANIQSLVSLKPDFIGFIFYPKSKRYAANVLDINILNQIPASVKKVGVFVDETLESVVEAIEKYKLDFAQLHGDESAEFCKKLKENGVGVMKAFSVDDNFNFEHTKPYEKVVDLFLFDTKTSEKGGSGQRFDWTILNQYLGSVPFLLAGGIDEVNFQEALFLQNKYLHGLDLNSKFEIEPGLKDIDKLKKVLEIKDKFSV